MKKLLFLSFVSMLILSCNQKAKTDDTPAPSKKADDMKALYEKNLATLKTAIAAFEKKDMEGWAATVADNVVWQSPAYGDTVKTKAHWKEVLSGFSSNWDSLKLTNPNFLPGLDSTTLEFDGSVRYYGSWIGRYKSGVWTNVAFYGSYDFDKDGKVSSGTEFFDVGGLMKAVQAK